MASVLLQRVFVLAALAAVFAGEASAQSRVQTASPSTSSAARPARPAVAPAPATKAAVRPAQTPAQPTTRAPVPAPVDPAEAARRAAAARAAAEADRIAPDPTVRRGVMPNGLRYAIQRNGRPEKSVSIRFHVEAGSFEEPQDATGVAHFLEHMAFNGTRAFPEGELERVFSAAGIGFGRHQNAYTTALGTTYVLDVPQADAAKLDLSFRWLRDVADGMFLTPGAVEREKGVVAAEHDRGLGPERDWRKAVQAYRYPGLRGPTRDPIGARESILSMTPDKLRAFHQAWYRPELAHLVVVGDFDPDAMEAEITRRFGDWNGPGPAPARAAKGTIPADPGLQVFARSEPTLPTSVSICWLDVWGGRRPETVTRFRARAERSLYQRMIQDRFGELIRSPEPPFLGASAARGSAWREAEEFCLSATPRDDDWGRAMDALAREAKRVRAHGFTQAEVDRVMADWRAAYALGETAAPTRYSSSLANTALNDSVEGDVTETPAEIRRVFEQVAPQLTPDRAKARFLGDQRGRGPWITLSVPNAPDPAAVSARWQAAWNAPDPEPYVAPTVEPFAYTDFGPPGAVVERTEIADPGFTRFRFANGVVLNFKSVSYTRGVVDAVIRFGDGRREISDEDRMVALLGTSFLDDGGLGRHSIDQLRRATSGRSWSVGLSAGLESFALGGGGRIEDLDLQLQILTAFLTDPGFRPEIDPRLPTVVDAYYRGVETSPETQLADALLAAIDPDSPDRVPPRERLASVKTADWARVLRDPLVSAPLEISIAGDVDEARVLEAVSRTLGALPPRPARDARREISLLRYPETPPAPITARHRGARDRAVTTVVWPLYVASPERRREERALGLLSQIFDRALREKVREELGKAYAPSVGVSLPDFGDQGRLAAVVQTSPADLAAVEAAIQEVAAELAAGRGIDAAALEAVRKPALDAAATRRQTNSWWLGVMDGSARDPQGLKDALDWEEAYRSLTVDEVKAAARTWLSRPPIVARAIPTEPSVTAAAP